MRFSLPRRLVQLALRPSDAWVDIASGSGHPAAVLLPWPVLLAGLGPLSFLVGHGVVGGTGASFGRAMGFSLVYYAFVLSLVLGMTVLLRRLGVVLGCRSDGEEALKLAAWSMTPFFIMGLSLGLPLSSWESLVVVAGMLGGMGSGFLLYRGLAVVVRGDSRSRGLLAAATAGSLLAAWVLGLFLLIRILL